MSSPTPKHIAATTGVQPDTPNATHQNDSDLADGPPATDDEVGLECTGGG